MALRIHSQVRGGVLDFTVRGTVTGRLDVIGREEAVTLDLQGLPWPDLSGHRLSFDRPPHEYDSPAHLADGSLAVGTLGGEILRFDRALRLLARFRASEWPIMQLATDREGGLWIATQGDLVRTALPSPWTRFDAGDGLSGAIQDAVWYEGARWVASSRGALVEQPGAAGLQPFARAPGLREEVWDLHATPGALLGATRGGVRRLDAAARPRRW